MMTKEAAKQRAKWDREMFAKHGITKYHHYFGKYEVTGSQWYVAIVNGEAYNFTSDFRGWAQGAPWGYVRAMASPKSKTAAYMRKFTIADAWVTAQGA